MLLMSKKWPWALKRGPADGMIEAASKGGAGGGYKPPQPKFVSTSSRPGERTKDRPRDLGFDCCTFMWLKTELSCLLMSLASDPPNGKSLKRASLAVSKDGRLQILRLEGAFCPNEK